MIVSMTGFGDATTERDGTHYAVEIRSLNNRFFKPVIKLPDNVSGLEPELETMLREALGRVRSAVDSSGLRHNELWSYDIERGRLRPVRYGTSSDVQLWNSTDLAVQFALSRLEAAP